MKKLVLATIAITGFVFAQGCTCSKQEEQPAAVETAPEAAPTETAPAAPADGTAAPTETAPAGN